jgi:hypothetical protein
LFKSSGLAFADLTVAIALWRRLAA